MAARTLKVTTPALLGTSVVSASSAMASSDTMVISASTAQSSLDFSTLVIRATNQSTTASVILTIQVGTVYSEIGQGAKVLTTVATADTVIIGGQDFESARFLNTAGTVILSVAGTGATVIEAFQAPRSTE